MTRLSSFPALRAVGRAGAVLAVSVKPHVRPRRRGGALSEALAALEASEDQLADFGIYEMPCRKGRR